MKWKYCLSVSLYVCKTLSPLTASIAQIINKYPSLFLCPSFVYHWYWHAMQCSISTEHSIDFVSNTHKKVHSTINHLSIFQWMYLPITGNYFLFVALDSVERIFISHFFRRLFTLVQMPLENRVRIRARAIFHFIACWRETLVAVAFR